MHILLIMPKICSQKQCHIEPAWLVMPANHQTIARKSGQSLDTADSSIDSALFGPGNDRLGDQLVTLWRECVGQSVNNILYFSVLFMGGEALLQELLTYVSKHHRHFSIQCWQICLSAVYVMTSIYLLCRPWSKTISWNELGYQVVLVKCIFTWND